MAGLNLLTAIIIYWNTMYLGQAVASRCRAGLDCSPDLLVHIVPPGWPTSFSQENTDGPKGDKTATASYYSAPSASDPKPAFDLDLQSNQFAEFDR